MTAPPGGPYGQDPSGPNPYGQNPSWGGQPQNPSWGGQPQNPSWGGQPQDPYWGGQPQGGPYQQQPGSQYPYPPPGGQYPNQPQQYPQPGQQAPPGWPAGSYPGGPPPKSPRSKTPWLIVAGIAVLGVIALVVILVIGLNNNNSGTATPSETSTGAPTSQPGNTAQTATDCTANVSGGEKPAGDTISAGKLSFPATAAAGWMGFADDQTPNLIGAVGVAQEVPGANQWVMQAEVAVTNFVPSMDVATQASKLLGCIVNGPGYANASPTQGPSKTSSITVDGTKAARVDADVTIGDTARNVKGDSVVIIAVDTKPVTIFLGASPIGDPGSRATIEQVISALKVSKS